MTQRPNDTTGTPRNGMMADVRYVGLRVPDELHAWLTELAEAERRSLNAQVVVLLERVRREVEREQREGD
jgi:hypothetical protein